MLYFYILLISLINCFFAQEPMSKSLHIALLNHIKNENTSNSSHSQELVEVRDESHVITKDNQIKPLLNHQGISVKRFHLAEFYSKPIESNRKRKLSDCNKSNTKCNPITDEDLLRAITQPNVINLIAKNLEYYI